MSHEKTRLKKAELKIRDEDIKETADPLLSLKLTCPKALCSSSGEYYSEYEGVCLIKALKKLTKTLVSILVRYVRSILSIF